MGGQRGANMRVDYMAWLRPILKLIQVTFFLFLFLFLFFKKKEKKEKEKSAIVIPVLVDDRRR